MISELNSPSPTFRPFYNTKQFAEEVLGGVRTVRWVSAQCRAGKIKTVKVVADAPYMIPGSEARRLISR